MILRNYFRKRINLFKQATSDVANNTLESFIKGGLVFLVCVTLIWISVFLYVMFYYAYVPSIEHVRSVNLQFTPCDRISDEPVDKGVCSYPTAHVQLTKSNQLLMVGQPYRISLVLEVPESDRNKNLGMFLICARLSNKGSFTVSHSCRSTMLRYRSPVVHLLTVFSFTPFYIMNIFEEKQILTVELFNNFEEDQLYPVTDVYIELKSENLEVYSSKLHIDAHLTGIRYLMFHWPSLSAAFGVTFNLAVISFIIALSWWQLYGPSWVKEDEEEEDDGEADVEPVEETTTVIKLKNSFGEDEDAAEESQA